MNQGRELPRRLQVSICSRRTPLMNSTAGSRERYRNSFNLLSQDPPDERQRITYRPAPVSICSRRTPLMN